MLRRQQAASVLERVNQRSFGVQVRVARDLTTEAFFVNVQPCTLDPEHRKKAVEKIKLPGYGGHYVCVTGWTCYAPDELEEIAYEVGDNGDYSKIINNCQRYLNRFADRVLMNERGRQSLVL